MAFHSIALTATKWQMHIHCTLMETFILFPSAHTKHSEQAKTQT